MLSSTYKMFISLIAMSLGFFGLPFASGTSANKQHTPKHIELACQLNSEVIEKFSKAHNLKPIGIDAGLARGEVYLLGARFQMIGPKSIEEMRPLLVECIELYKSTINKCDEIQP